MSCTIGMCWLPSPSFAPAPSDQARFISGNMPPEESITGLVRNQTTRTPAATATCTEASHSSTSRLIQLSPAGSDSVSGRSVPSVG